MPQTPAGIEFGLYKKLPDGTQFRLGIGLPPVDTRPPGAVTNIHTTAQSPGGFVVTWTPPAIDAGHAPAATYEVAIGSSAPFIPNGSALTKSVVGLANATTYPVRVRPTTAAGIVGPIATGTATTGIGTTGGGTPGRFGVASDDLHGRISVIEATGGKVEVARVYAQPQDNWGQSNPSGAGGLHDQILTEFTAGRDVCLSIKTSGGDWSNVAAGTEDAAINGLAAFLHATMPTFPARIIFICIHHEPSTNNSMTTGEGGTPAEFAAMNNHALPILKAAAPTQIRVGIIGNGYWFRQSGAKATDAQLDAWTPASSRAFMDYIGGDDYQPGQLGTPSGWGEDPTLRTINRIAWFGRVGYTGACLIGETNAFVGQYLVNMLDLAKHSPAFTNGAVCIWDNKNSRAGYLSDTSPPGQTAPLRLTGVRNMLKNWHDGL